MALDAPYIGHVIRETADKIVFGYRFDVSKSKIKEVGRNVILNMDVDELMSYKVDRDAPLPRINRETSRSIREQTFAIT